MNEEVLFYFDEINIKSIVRDVLHNFWMILIAGLSAVLLVSGYRNIIYEAEYTSRATLIVSAKGSGMTGSYANLSTTSEMAEVFSNVFSSSILKKRIVEELEVPLYPSNAIPLRSYQKKAALAAGVLMGIFLVFMSVMRQTIKTEAAAVRRLKGTKLALVGHEEKNRTFRTRIRKKNKAILITNPITTFGYVETFRKLAFRVQSEMKKKGQKVLLISSVEENEGKSTIASNIALALAQSGKKVLLVDMDLRRPAIYKIFDIESKNENGFWKEEIPVSGGCTMQLLLNKKVVKNPAIFMKEKGIGALLERSRETADIVIVDSSPMNAAADTELVLPYVDASVLVVRKDWVHTSNLNHGIDILEKGDTDFLGYVLNDYENRKSLSRGRDGYKYGYGYGTYQKNLGDRE